MLHQCFRLMLQWSLFYGAFLMFFLTAKYVHYLFGRSWNATICLAIFTVDASGIIVEMNMLLQLAFLKFLYTNIWCNVGNTNDEFWECFLWCAHLVHFLLLCFLLPWIGFPTIDEISICMGIPPECQEMAIGPPLFPDWMSAKMYPLLIVFIILPLTWRSSQKEKHLNELFLNRFGQNSKYGRQHLGVSQRWMTRIIAVVVVVLVAIEAAGYVVFKGNDYNQISGSTFYVTFEVIQCIFFAVLAPLAFLLQDQRERKGLLKAISRWS